MSSETLDRPIIVVGTHRSGTTFLANLLARHPDIAYWEEPRQVWVTGNAYAPDDALRPEHATKPVIRKIRRSFARYAREHGGARFVEKTPSNCLRLPFVEAVCPDALYVHIHRDGRAVVNSTLTMVTTSAPTGAWIFKRLAQTPAWEWPAYFSRTTMTVGRRLLGKPMTFWGPRPPGWRAWIDEGLERPALLARQWAHTVSAALDFRDAFVGQPEGTRRWLDVPYAELTASPREVLERVLSFCSLDVHEPMLEHAAGKANPARSQAWRDELDPDLARSMRSEIEPTLERLGYSWD